MQIVSQCIWSRGPFSSTTNYLCLEILSCLVAGLWSEELWGGVIKANFIFYWVVAFYNQQRRCPPMNEYLWVKFVPHFEYILWVFSILILILYCGDWWCNLNINLLGFTWPWFADIGRLFQSSATISNFHFISIQSFYTFYLFHNNLK